MLMTDDFPAIFKSLKSVFPSEKRLTVKADTSAGYMLVTKAASPFPQHKGEPMFFGAVRLGKAYVSFHLMPVYMCPELMESISPQLKKRMQGKSCFNFKTDPPPELLAELKQLTKRGVQLWSQRNWL